MVVPAERGMRETSIKVDCILVEVVLEVGVDKVVVEKKMRLSRETFEDFLVFLAQTWRWVLEASRHGQIMHLLTSNSNDGYCKHPLSPTC